MLQSTGLIEVTSHTDTLELYVGSAAIPNHQYLTELGKRLKNQLLSPVSNNPSDMACCSPADVVLILHRNCTIQ